MAQSEMSGNELVATLLGVDFSAAETFEKMTSSEQLYIGGLAVAQARRGVSLVNENYALSGPFAVSAPDELLDIFQDAALEIAQVLAETRLRIAEDHFFDLATRIFSANVMVLNGTGNTVFLDQKTKEVDDMSRYKIDFTNREFVEIAKGCRTREASPITILRVPSNNGWPYNGSKFYATYYEPEETPENHWHERVSGHVAIGVNTDPLELIDGESGKNPLVWSASRPLQVTK